MFFRDRMDRIQEILSSRGLRGNPYLPASFVGSDQIDPYIYAIYSDIMGICALVNDKTCLFVPDLLLFEEIVVSTCHRLLRFRTLGDSIARPDVNSMYHVGLIGFMMTTFLQFNRYRIMDYKLLSLRIRDVLKNEPTEHANDATFWLMMVGGIWVSNEADGDWIIPKIRRLAQQRKIDTWDEAVRVAYMFPWIYALHDEPARRLWTQAQRSH